LCNFCSIYIIYNCGPRLNNTTWWVGDGDPCIRHWYFGHLKICVALLDIILISLKKLGFEFWTGDINVSVYVAV
jgi:hypothetical protein